MSDVVTARGIFGSSGSLTTWSTNRLALLQGQSPFLDYGSIAIPRDVEALWRWCSFFAISNPALNCAIVRKSAYPVTALNVEFPVDEIAEEWSDLLTKRLAITMAQLMFNMDMYVFGRAALSVFPPFRKYFICRVCNRFYLADAIKYRVNTRTKSFDVRCLHCDAWQPARVIDIVVAAPGGFTIRRWTPQELVGVELGFINKKAYYVRPSTELRNKIKRGVPAEINNTPQEIVEAVLRDELVRIREDRLFVRMEEGAILPLQEQKTSVWPFGSFCSSLKAAFHLQLAMKNEEVALVTQMIPFRAISPEISPDPAANVFQTGSYTQWSDLVKNEYSLFLQDPGRLAVLPVAMRNIQTQTLPSPMLPKDPVYQRLGEILCGIRVPQSLVIEGAPWSGAVPYLKLFEADGAKNQTMQVDLAEFVVTEINRVLRWPKPRLSMAAMMSVDAIQRMQAYNQLAAAGKLDDQSLHEALGMDHQRILARLETDRRRRRQQQLEEARANLAEQLRQQQEMGPPPGPPPGGAPGAPTEPATPSAPPVVGAATPPAPRGLPPTSGFPAVAEVEAGIGAGSAAAGNAAETLGGSHLTAAQLLGQITEPTDPTMAQRLHDMLPYMAPQERALLLEQLREQVPTMFQLVMNLVHAAEPEAPLPEQRPPRRQGY